MCESSSYSSTWYVAVVQPLSCFQLFVTSWTAAHQASLVIVHTNPWRLLKLMSIESMMPPNHLILCRPLLPPPSIFPSFRVFYNESVLYIQRPKYCSFTISIQSFQWFPLELTDWIFLQSKGLSGVFSKTTFQKHQFSGAQLSLWSNFHIHTWLLKNHSFDKRDLCWQSNVSAF